MLNLMRFVAVLLLALSVPANAQLQDSPRFAIGSRVDVFLNWSSFTAEGIPSFWKEAVENQVASSLRQWNSIAQANVRLDYGGTTTSTVAGADEIVIQMTL